MRHATAGSGIRFVGLALAALIAAVVLAGCQTPNPTLRNGAVAAIKDGDYPSAEAKLTQAIDQDPTDWRAKFLLGRLRLAQRQPGDAQLLLERALTLRRDHEETPRILDALAESLFLQQKNAELVNRLEQATREYDTLDDYIRLGRYLARMEDIDGARLAYRKAMLLEERTPALYLALADFYEQTNDRDAALRALRHAYYLDERTPGLAARLQSYGVQPGPGAGLPPE